MIGRNYIRNTLVCSPFEILQVQSGLIKSGWSFFDEIIFLSLSFNFFFSFSFLGALCDTCLSSIHSFSLGLWGYWMSAWKLKAVADSSLNAPLLMFPIESPVYIFSGCSRCCSHGSGAELVLCKGSLRLAAPHGAAPFRALLCPALPFPHGLGWLRAHPATLPLTGRREPWETSRFDINTGTALSSCHQRPNKLSSGKINLLPIKIHLDDEKQR